MPVLISVIVILAPPTEAPPASVILPTNEPVTACPNANDEPNKRNIETARSNRTGLFILPSKNVLKWFYATATSMDEAIDMPAVFTSKLSVQVLDFEECCLLIQLCRLLYGFYSSGQRFACSFLRIPPRDGHPCRSANDSPCRVRRGLSPPNGRALPGAQHKGAKRSLRLCVQAARLI